MTLSYSRLTALVLLLIASGCDVAPGEQRANSASPAKSVRQAEPRSPQDDAGAITANMSLPTDAPPPKRSPSSRVAAPLPDPAPTPLDPPEILLSNSSDSLPPEPPQAHAAPSPPPLVRTRDLPPSDDAAPVRVFPAEVLAFMVDRDGCDHFRGEVPYDNERRVYLEQSIRQLCIGTDARLAALRRRYRLQAEVMAALSSYEDRIEAPARAPDQLSW